MNDLHLPFRLIQRFHAQAAAVSPRRTLRRASRLLSLEPRFMFDGAAVATAAHGADAKADAHAAALAAEAAAAASVHQVRDADASANNGKKEVVFVDTSVADYRTLEAGVRAGVAIVEYDGSKDGLAQIAAWAQNNSGYDAIHILSHGSEGTLNLGTDVLNDTSLSSATVQAELADIGHALNSGGDILLYGCDVAAGSDGQQFIDDLAHLTGADVAASTNATGDAALGGDWTLEAHAGQIDAQALAITDYHGLLNVVTLTDADLSVDAQTPTVTDAQISISGGSGAAGTYKIGDTVTAVWNNTASGDNNSDPIASVTFDFSAFGGSLVTATNSGGVWVASYTIVAGSIDGLANRNVVVTVVDQAGNAMTTADTSNATVDNVAPGAPSKPTMTSASDTGISSSDGITNVGTPTFTGTAASGSIVTLYDTDGTTVLGSTVAVGGAWSITTVTLAAGSHTITAKATDAAGNVSVMSVSSPITIDTTPPTGLALDTTSVSSADASSGATLATLSSHDDLAVTYSFAVGNGSNDADNGSFTLSGGTLQVGGSSLSAGVYHIYVAATDAAGNVSEQAFSITVMGAPYVTSIVRTGGASQTVSTLATTISYTITFSAAVTGVDASDFSLTPTGSAAGTIASVTGSGTTYTVTVNNVSGDGTLRLDLNSSGTGIQGAGAIDIFGGYIGGQLYTLDHTAPAAPSKPTMSADTGISSTDGITKTSAQTFSGTAESGVTVTLYDTDGTTVLGSTTAVGGSWYIGSVALSVGSHVITAKAVDAAGNVSVASDALVMVIDQTSPTVTITSSASSLKAGETATITFTFSEDPTYTFSYSSLTVTNGTISNLTGSGLVRTVVFTPVAGMNGGIASISIAPGSYTDVAGNAGTGAVLATLSFDTLVPNAPSTPVLNPGDDRGVSGTDGITNVTTPTFTGTAEAGVTVTLYDTDGVTVLGSTVAANGSWSITTLALSEGTHTITARAADSAGNVSNLSSSVVVQIQTTPPAAAVSSMTLSTDSGESGSDFITNYPAQVISGSLSAPLASGEVVQVSLDNGATWVNATSGVGATAWSIAATLSGAGVLRVRVMDMAGNTSAEMTHTYVVDTTAPTVDSVAVPANGTYTSNQNLDFTVNFSEAVIVSGTPRIALTVGATTVYATYISGSGTNALVFSYTVANGNLDLDGIAVGALSANGGAIRDIAGNDAALTLNSIGSTVNVIVDATQPHIVDVTSTTADGLYKAGDTVTIVVTFDSAVNVATAGGTPTLSLNNGGVANYFSGSGTNTLVFTYTVGAGQDVADLDYSAVGALTLNGGTIKGVGGATDDAALGLAAPGAAGSLGANKDIVIDTIAPSTTFGDLALSADTGASDSDFITSVASQTITATLSHALDSGDRVYGSLDNGATWVDITGKVSGTSLSWDGVTLSGSGTIALRVVDAAGNAGTVRSQAYVLDVTPPTAPTVDALQSSSTTPVLSGDATLAAGETLTVTVDGATYAVVPVDGRWQLDLASAVPASGSITLAIGASYSVTATVVDAAGNVSNGTGTLSIVAAPPPIEPPPPVEPSQPGTPTPPVAVAPPPPLPRPPAPIFSSVEPVSHDNRPPPAWTTATPVLPPTPLPDTSLASSGLETSIQSVLAAGNLNALAFAQSPVDRVTSLIQAMQDNGRAEPGVMTHGDGFHVVIVPASPGLQGLMLYQGIAAQSVPLSGRSEFEIPSDAFAHTDPNATVQLSASLADGKPLPAWLRFDGRLGRFIADPPSGAAGDIPIRVVARDSAGKEAATVFHLRIGAAHAAIQGAALADSAAHVRSQPGQPGRTALTEQLQLAARQRAGAGALDRLAHLAHALHNANT